MKHALQSLFLTALLLFVGQSLSAYDFVVDGLCYRILNEEDHHYYDLSHEEDPVVEVTYHPDGYYDLSGEVVIPSEVTYDGKTYKVISIGEFAFNDCYEVTSIVIPGSVKYIGDNAFSDLEGLDSINIPEGVEYIGLCAFMNCWSLTQVTIPSTVNYIERDAFENCSRLDSIVVKDGNTNYDSRNNCNALIETATNTLITGCKNTIIPTSVTTIGSYAFYSQQGLTEITLPEGLISIDEYAFDGCSLTSLTIPASLTNINPRSFLSCGQLKEIKVAAGNPKYDSRNDCNAIIETASNKLFLGCETTVIPEDIITIGENAFAFSGFAGTTVPESITNIEESAFEGCKKMKQFTIPSGVTRISDDTFYGSDLQSIDIPENITYIGDYAFGACELTEITIPETVTKIGESILYASYELISAVIPNSIKTLNATFYGCDELKKVSLGYRVKYLEKQAFLMCYKLSEIYVNSPVPPICRNNDLKPINKETCILYVPEAYIDAYRQAEGWKEFKHIEVNPDAPEPIFRITYQVDGEVIQVDNVKYGNAITLMEAPSKEGFVFSGWEGYPEDLTMPAADLVVTGSFQASGIEQMANETPATSVTYDIYGRQVSEPQPGTLYLRGNRKVIVR